MAIIKTEFALALNQVATERGISSNEVIESIEAAVLAAYKKEYPESNEDELKATISKETGETKIYKDKKNITPPGFGRIAAQTAKQVIIQKIREAEKKTVISHYTDQIGKIIKGRIIRYDGYSAYVDIGKAQGIIPKEEQIRNEHYQINNTLTVLIKEITNDKFGNTRIILSRTDPKLIEELFKREVPEVTNNTVEIKKIAREPGERAKIAVFSGESGVDPVGACVGQKGIRVQTITDELGGSEKIDIIQWSNDNTIFLTSALSPAKIDKVEIDEKEKKAKVFVDEEQAPLAIGKRGINVNLASKLTEFEIDIKQISEKKLKEPEEPKEDEKKAKEEKKVNATPLKKLPKDDSNNNENKKEKKPKK